MPHIVPKPPHSETEPSFFFARHHYIQQIGLVFDLRHSFWDGDRDNLCKSTSQEAIPARSLAWGKRLRVASDQLPFAIGAYAGSPPLSSIIPFCRRGR
jgi:hypothetical protein